LLFETAGPDDKSWVEACELWRVFSFKIRTLMHNFDEVVQKLYEVGQLVYEVGQLLDGVGQLLHGGR